MLHNYILYSYIHIIVAIGFEIMYILRAIITAPRMWDSPGSPWLCGDASKNGGSETGLASGATISHI